MTRICLVSCVSKKLPREARAADIYVSSLFIKAREFALRFNDRWFILSAKHGLVSPQDILEPYNETLIHKPAHERKQWAHKVFSQLRNNTDVKDEITVIAGQHYPEFLIPLMENAGYRVSAPMAGMSIGRQLHWLNKQLASPNRLVDLHQFYTLLARLERELGGKRTMRDCTGKLNWPGRGVYFFFEPQNFRTLDPVTHRVVRVGTHGVSRGSRSTLWHRLRTHKGTDDDRGNHRGSIFRLHVGAAILNRDGSVAQYPSWGHGQSAPTEVRKAEEQIERKVSEYIAQMSVLHLLVGDDPGPSSDRAYLERNAIALLAGEEPAEKLGKSWLGNYSPNPTIRTTGLWNLDHVSRQYDRTFLEILEYYIDVTVGRRSQPSQSIAPTGWRTAVSKANGQGEILKGVERR